MSTIEDRVAAATQARDKHVAEMKHKHEEAVHVDDPSF